MQMRMSFHHVCIETNTYTESICFYQKLFAFDIIEESKGFHGREYNTWLKNGDIIIELQTPKADHSKINYQLGTIGIMHICFVVNNLDEEIKRIKELGFNIFKDGKEKYEICGKYITKIVAPEGTVIELREY